MWRKGDPFALLVRMQIGAATVGSSMEIPQTFKNESAFWLSNPTDGNISKGTQNINLKEHKHPYVHCSIIYNHQDMEAAQVPISGWVDKKAVVHLHNGILLGHKNKEILSFVTAWMGLESITLSQISQSVKEKYHMILLICGIWLTNKQNRDRIIDGDQDES